MKITVVHHSADFDGLFSGAVAYYSLMADDLTLVGWDFGDPLVEISPDVEEVYVIDLPPSCLQNPNTDKLIWIDHHKSSIDKFDSSIKGYRIDGVAACRLAWQWFNSLDLPSYEDFVNRKVKEPFALTLAGEHDVWDHRDPNAMWFQFGLNASPIKWTPQSLSDEFFEDNTSLKVLQMASNGTVIEQWHHNYAAEVCAERSYLVEFEGIKFCTLCSVHARMSTWYPEETIMNKAEALLNVRIQGDGVARISLYHREGFKHHDLSLIAVKYGGGGHKGACGFELPVEKALELGLIR